LLVFEDLHWIDAETQALLDSVVESLPTCRLLLLANYRPEYKHAWGSKTCYRQVRIDPLLPESAEELLGGLLGNDAGLRSLKRLLIERTEGNPFFLEESVRTLVETKVLAGEEVPSSAARLRSSTAASSLQHRPSRPKQTASRPLRHREGALHAPGVAEGRRQLRRGLGISGSRIPLRAAPSRTQYTFKHALTHDVAYGPALGRRTLHRQIMTIERLHPDRLAEHRTLAHHAFRGEAWAGLSRTSSRLE
jgi:predicted ATPase